MCLYLDLIQKFRMCLTSSLCCTSPLPLLALLSAHIPWFQSCTIMTVCVSLPSKIQAMQITHTSTDIMVCFLNRRILHIYFKPNSTNGRVGVTAVRCGHRIQTNCRDISFTHSQWWHCCGEIKRWHLWRCTWGKEQLYNVCSPLGMPQDYHDRSEVKRKHQFLVYPDVWLGKTHTT